MPAAVPYFIQVTQAHNNHTRKREVLLVCGNSTLQLHGQWAWFNHYIQCSEQLSQTQLMEGMVG